MKKTKVEKGITLIALIITIIVLLILAVVAIGAIQNDGIIDYAKNARTEYEAAQRNEKAVLDRYLADLKNNNPNKESTGPLGNAQNTSNYGKKVIGYTSKGEGLENLVWRVFYQDEKNVYLISETVDGNYPVQNLTFYDKNDEDNTYTKKSILQKYNSGADVSKQGQELMPLASTLFTEDNTNENIIATAYMCDIAVWDSYTDSQGNAAWAIGAPTIELFAKSYNASNLGHTIELSADRIGYIDNTQENWFTEAKNGIYKLKSEGPNFWWIASPNNLSRYLAYGINDLNGFLNYNYSGWLVDQSNSSRPIVCIPVSNFDYTLQ